MSKVEQVMEARRGKAVELSELVGKAGELYRGIMSDTKELQAAASAGTTTEWRRAHMPGFFSDGRLMGQVTATLDAAMSGRPGINIVAEIDKQHTAFRNIPGGPK